MAFTHAVLRRLTLTLAVLATTANAGVAFQHRWLVITNTRATKPATTRATWLASSDYFDLKPGLFVEVEGAYRDSKNAKEACEKLKEKKTDCYVGYSGFYVGALKESSKAGLERFRKECSKGRSQILGQVKELPLGRSVLVFHLPNEGCFGLKLRHAPVALSSGPNEEGENCDAPKNVLENEVTLVMEGDKTLRTIRGLFVPIGTRFQSYLRPCEAPEEADLDHAELVTQNYPGVLVLKQEIPNTTCSCGMGTSSRPTIPILGLSEDGKTLDSMILHCGYKSYRNPGYPCDSLLPKAAPTGKIGLIYVKLGKRGKHGHEMAVAGKAKEWRPLKCHGALETEEDVDACSRDYLEDCLDDSSASSSDSPRAIRYWSNTSALRWTRQGFSMDPPKVLRKVCSGV
jgi:hypothetical protein